MNKSCLELVHLGAQVWVSGLELAVAEIVGLVAKVKADVVDASPDHRSKVLMGGQANGNGLDVVQLEY